MNLQGLTLVYEHDNGEVYRLRFGEDTVAWKCLMGGAGESGTEAYDAAEVGPNTLFVSWSEPSGEAVSLVANLERHVAYVNYTHGSERHFLGAKIIQAKGSIRAFAVSAEVEAEIRDTNSLAGH